MNLFQCLLISALVLYSIQCVEEWVVKLHEDQNPDQIASELGLKYAGPLKGPLGKRHHRFHSSEKHEPNHDSFKFHRQHPVQRSKRSQKQEFTSSDPMWGAAWFYHGPQSYIDIIPAWEQNLTGMGIVISIVDDGVEYKHPDLMNNYSPEASWDYNSNDPDPTPNNPKGDRHGTSCAGTAAAIRNNQHCLHGSAFDAKFGAIRLIEEPTTDAQEAEALTHSLELVDIYSCSWGPTDNGVNTSPAGPLTQEAIIHGITYGRNGKGAIYVWAAGNGAEDEDNCNYDGLANQPYTIAIGALSHTGKRSSYSEPGAALFAVSPSSGDSSFILTTTPVSTGQFGSQGECTTSFGGTSAATPLAAGMIALILQANPALTWREVQYVIVESATKIDPTNPDWMPNGAGIQVNHEYGFGVINASKAIEVARSWSKQIHYYHTFISEARVMDLPIFDNSLTRPIVSYIYVQEADCFVKSIEHIQVSVKINHPKATDLTVVLTSPSGTPSVLAQSHAFRDAPALDWVSFTENNTVQTGHIAKMGIATFGPPMVSLVGEIFVVDPPKACTPLPPIDTSGDPPLTKVNKIALILRGDCPFYDKVLIAQEAGYDGVLIENSSPEPLNMNHDGSEDLITIPSLMIGSTDGEALRAQFSPIGDSTVRMNASIYLKYYKVESPDFSFADWTFMSVRHWGEDPIGVWSLSVYDEVPGDLGIFDSWSLLISGSSDILPTPPDDETQPADQTKSIVLLLILFGIIVVIGVIWWYRRRFPHRDPKKFTALELESGADSFGR